jgi:hypothetical protein
MLQNDRDRKPIEKILIVRHNETSSFTESTVN